LAALADSYATPEQLLDRAAIEAVRQSRYSPLLLNGQPERFVLTVTVSFSLNV
jgi:outer membrane biosynthesis protein TonB